MNVEHDQVGDALVAFRLEVVFRHPHGVEPVFVQGLRDGLGLAVNGYQMVIAESAVVHRRSTVADIGHIHMTGIQAVEFGNHL